METITDKSYPSDFAKKCSLWGDMNRRRMLIIKESMAMIEDNGETIPLDVGVHLDGAVKTALGMAGDHVHTEEDFLINAHTALSNLRIMLQKVEDNISHHQVEFVFDQINAKIAEQEGIHGD